MIVGTYTSTMLLIYSSLGVVFIIWLLSLLIVLCSPPPRPLPSAHGPGTRKKGVLLVIAHPDDESMFFSPTLLSLASLGHYDIRLLCLSNGNAEGLGAVRTQELVCAASLLKVRQENVEILDDLSLQDGHNVIWSHDLIAQILEKSLAMHTIDIIITFDGYGVSGHPNHAAVYRGLCAFLINSMKNGGEKERRHIEAWKLESVNIFRKYCGPVNALWSMVTEHAFGTKHQIHCFYNSEPHSTIGAMKKHATQWIWYRRLFVILSYYTYVNTLQKINY